MPQKIVTFVNAAGKQVHCVEHLSHAPTTVIMAHGFLSSNIGPRRMFVRLSEKLASHGVGSVRFDQPGSGNSAGSFVDSSFEEWLAVLMQLISLHAERGRKVSIMGQSMGAACALIAGSRLSKSVNRIVAWVPDPNLDPITAGQADVVEEEGQLINLGFWREARASDVIGHVRQLTVPTLILQADEDQYVDKANREALHAAAAKATSCVSLAGCNHSSWSYEVSERVIAGTASFLTGGEWQPAFDAA
jgi:alpha-beta hydrolase superfamily lysophospholipase